MSGAVGNMGVIVLFDMMYGGCDLAMYTLS